MTPVNPAEVIAEALTAHDGYGDNAFDDFYACPCGWTSDIVVYDERKAAHVAHQASVIAGLPDIAIVPSKEHPYFVWEQGYQASITDRTRNNQRWVGDFEYMSNPYSLGEPVPDRVGGES